MGQITITKPSGATVVIGGSNPLVVIRKAEQRRTLMGEDVVELQIESTTPLNIGILDKIVAYGNVYTLYELPSMRRISNTHLSYTCLFKGAVHEMDRVAFLNEDVTGVYYSGDFSLMTDLTSFIDVIVTNMNRIYGSGTWVKQMNASAPAQNLTFSNESCLSALSLIMNSYGWEYEVTRIGETRTLHVHTRIERDLTASDVFAYGRGKGFLSLDRKLVQDENMVTKLYAFGSDKNIPSNYRNFSPRLKLPVGSIGGERSYLLDSAAQSNYGVIEQIKIFEDVFPHFSGVVSSLGADIYTFYDVSINFDVNTYLIGCLAAKIHFNSGRLSGYEFTIKSFDYATKKFIINKITDDRGLEIPNSNDAFKISVGDSFTILDITLPASYITNAEGDLQTIAQTWLDNHKFPVVTYEGATDDYYLLNHAPVRNIDEWYFPGDEITLKDPDIIGTDIAIRITSLTRDLFVKERYKFTFANSVYRNLRRKFTREIKNLTAILADTPVYSPASRRLQNSTIYASQKSQSQT